jgi:hypothetical protein
MPLAGNPTTMRTGLLGYGSAALAGDESPKITDANTAAPKPEIFRIEDPYGMKLNSVLVILDRSIEASYNLLYVSSILSA